MLPRDSSPGKRETELTEGAVEIPGDGITKLYCDGSAVAAAENNQSQTEHLNMPDIYKDDTSPDYFSFEHICVEI